MKTMTSPERAQRSWSEVQQVASRPNLDFPKADTAYLTHNYHSYPAKFIPQLANWIITNYSSEKDVVLDPMCGSGTALIESSLLGRNSIGIDIDPLACLLAQVKTSVLDSKVLARKRIGLLDAIKNDFRKHRGEGSLIEEDALIPYVIPEFYRRDELFLKDVQQKLALIKARIEAVDESEYKKFFLVAVSAILRPASNCDPKDIEPKLPPPNRRRKTPPDVYTLFERKVKVMEKKMNLFSAQAHKGAKATVYLGDARKLPDSFGEVDLIVTSPPYANSVDYPRVHKLSFYWLGMTSSEALPDLAREYVGTDLVRKEFYDDLEAFGISSLDSAVHEIFKLDKKRAGIVSKYFSDMRLIIGEMYRKLRAGGKCCIVIGDSRVKKVLVPTHEIFKTIAKEQGFKLLDEFPRIVDPRKKQTANAPNDYGGGAINVEYVLVFEK